MKNIFKNTAKFFGTLLCAQFIVQGALAGESPIAPVKGPQSAAESPLTEVISNLADFAAFRKTDDFFDAVLSSHCKKKNSIKDDDGTSTKYICVPTSGIKTIDIDTRQPKGEAPYLMSLRLTFSYQDYGKVKKVVQTKLGRPSKDTSSFVNWSYKSDKALNEYGDPAVAVSRDKELSLSVFQLGLEQGP